MNIFIDLDQTILDFHIAEAEAIKKTLNAFSVPADDTTAALYSSINDSLWKQLEKGQVTREQILLRRFQILFEKLGKNCDAVAVNEVYKKQLAQGHWFIDGAVQLLEELNKTNHRLFIASNGTKSVQIGRIKSADIQKYFEKIFLSEDIGYNKPDKRFFEECFKAAGITDTDNSIILGDSLSSDIQGGINAGIRTCWFNPQNAPVTDIRPDYIITSLDQFLDLIYEVQ